MEAKDSHYQMLDIMTSIDLSLLLSNQDAVNIVHIPIFDPKSPTVQ
jgi:hypothetical protein